MNTEAEAASSIPKQENPSSMVERARLRSGSRRMTQAGFTLIEAIVATMVLVVGIAGVSNLMVVSISSNSLGNRVSTAAFLAGQKMEQLRAIPFDDAAFADSLATSLDVAQANYNENVTMPGGSVYHTRWNIRTVGAFGQSLKFIAVRTESLGAFSRRTRAEFTSYRACTRTGCTP